MSNHLMYTGMLGGAPIRWYLKWELVRVANSRGIIRMEYKYKFCFETADEAEHALAHLLIGGDPKDIKWKYNNEMEAINVMEYNL